MNQLNPIDVWHGLIEPDDVSAAFFETYSRQMREARLTFGGRVHSPFLRPLFVTEQDEARIRVFAETIAVLGERVVAAALEQPALLDELGLRDEEQRLVAIDPGYATASTSSRLDAFLLPDSLQAAEYNAESPAGLAYTEVLAEVVSRLPIMERFSRQFDVHPYPLMARLLDALIASYREWGGTAAPPQIAIVDWRGVPTWSEFQILQERFTALGVPTLVCTPEELEFDGRSLFARGQRIDLVYRRVLMNDILEKPAENDAMLRAYTAGSVCMANTFRCKIPHKKAFFALPTDGRFAHLWSAGEQEAIRGHVPWTRVVREARTTRDGRSVDLVSHIRANRDSLVMKPNDDYGGAGVTLGWDTSESDWETRLVEALAAPAGSWVVQEKIAVRREVFPYFQDGQAAVMKDMLVDMAPYVFRGKLAGFLTRLSASGLANVTSGGGQVPSFRVKAR
jgi:uncharacterized circularly permuted ATP-grasp superfamily protein